MYLAVSHFNLQHLTCRELISNEMAPSPPTSPSPDQEEEQDETADLPLTMAASVVLEHLPKNAHKALETAGELEQAKGIHHPPPSALLQKDVH